MLILSDYNVYLQGDFQIPVDLVKNLGAQHLQKHCCFNRHLQADLGI